MTAAELSAAEVIAHLELKPHPEGGWYRETFRDSVLIDGRRAASTAIYFLLEGGVVSRWHRVDAAEAWHWYAGSPLELCLAEGQHRTTSLLGPALTAGQRPQRIVPAGMWQQARSLGAWTLVGCTVAPGFEFAGFEIVDDNAVPPF